ncbi:MAG TPA: cytochrome ubiquinol oxidase subunit I, partial [Acidimicrobiia bacterium]|nr:cytochrome ubiquinol oxidase subunit I [Acidimicrobiia bacterium]
WTISSPPPEHNFDVIPVVHSEDDFWHRKYSEDVDGNAVPRTDAPMAAPADESIHLPSPSFYPALAASGILVMLLGLVYLPWGLVAVGAGMVVTLWGLFGWSLEPLTREEHG